MQSFHFEKTLSGQAGHSMALSSKAQTASPRVRANDPSLSISLTMYLSEGA